MRDPPFPGQRQTAPGVSLQIEIGGLNWAAKSPCKNAVQLSTLRCIFVSMNTAVILTRQTGRRQENCTFGQDSPKKGRKQRRRETGSWKKTAHNLVGYQNLRPDQ